MYCPFCSHQETKVLESRVLDNSVRRRRACLECQFRFTTHETFSLQMYVLKKDGREQLFDLNKICHSIEKSLNKPQPELINTIVKAVEQKIIAKRQPTIKTTEIGKFVLQELKKVDKIAYLRYASVYKAIEDPLLLKKELNTIV